MAPEEQQDNPPSNDAQATGATPAGSAETGSPTPSPGNIPSSPKDFGMDTEAPADTGGAGEANAAEAERPARRAGEPQAVSPLPDFSEMLAEAAASSIDLLNDVDLDVKVELGRTQLTVEHILRLTNGSVVELDKLAGDPVDILVNEQLIARGEVLVVNDNFCVRINEIVPGVSEQIKQTH